MDAMHNYAPTISESARFASLCGVISFITNSKRLLTINWSLTPAEVSVLTSLLTSGTGLSHLVLSERLPLDATDQLGSAISCSSSTIRELSLGRRDESAIGQTPKLLRVLATSVTPMLELLRLDGIIMCEASMCDSIGKCTGLRSLAIYLPNQCPAPPGLAEIGKLHALESLEIDGISFSESDAAALIATLKDLPLLSELRIRNANIKAEAARTIGNLAATGRIRKLDLHCNKIGDEGAAAIVDAILVSAKKRGCKLQELNLGTNNIHSAGERKVAELVAHLRVLNLSCNSIRYVFHKLRAAQSLEKFDVSECRLGAAGVKSLLDTSLPKLRMLRMGQNSAGDLGAQTVSLFLLASPYGCALVKLQIQENDITEAGARELATAFVKTYALKSLRMSENPIGPRGVTAIVDALIVASTIPMCTIGFAGCNIKDDGASAVGRFISRRGCRRVYLSANDIYTTGAKAIADSIADSKFRTQVLDLGYNALGDEVVTYLLDKVTQPPDRSVRELDITHTGMVSVKGAMAVKRAVETSDVLSRLHTGGYLDCGEVHTILQKVEAWERNSKPPGTAILVQSVLYDIDM